MWYLPIPHIRLEKSSFVNRFMSSFRYCLAYVACLRLLKFVICFRYLFVLFFHLPFPHFFIFHDLQPDRVTRLVLYCALVLYTRTVYFDTDVTWTKFCRYSAGTLNCFTLRKLHITFCTSFCQVPSIFFRKTTHSVEHQWFLAFRKPKLEKLFCPGALRFFCVAHFNLSIFYCSIVILKIAIV